MSPTLQILEALRERLLSVPLPDHPAAVRVFEAVEIFHKKSLREAITRLYKFKEGRLGILVWTDRDFVSDPTHPSLIRLTQEWGLSLLLTDRDFGSRQRASSGDADTVGVVAMQDAVLHPETGVIGEDLGFEGHALIPESCEAFDLQDDEKKLPGRAAAAITFRFRPADPQPPRR